MTAISLGQHMEPAMPTKATEEFLEQLVKDQWLVERSGSYTLSPRCLMELSGYLHEQFQGVIKECHMCSELVTVGERCESQPCNVRIHKHCAEQLFVTNRQSLNCPSCRTTWSRTSTFGLSPP
ncbi:unnamed protein product [Absidia cylindrospora]